MNRVTFLIDGFNLYHSARQAASALGIKSAKWLDLSSLCNSYLPLLGKDTTLEDIYYFSALAKQREAKDPWVTLRHTRYLECLKATGVTVVLGRFKKKKVYCTNCRQQFTKFEEKETDVAIAVKLLEVLVSGSCDTAILITGDTDLAPAVKTAGVLCPNKQIGFVFPYKRHNKELKKLVSISFNIKSGQYSRHQFPDPFMLPSGKQIRKPDSW